MPNIKETQNYPIKNKIIKLHNIRQLANILNEEYLCSKEKGERVYLSYEINCDSGALYESSDLDILSDDSIINSKTPTKITMWYKNASKDTNVSVSLKTVVSDKYDYENDITVIGSDTNWVNGILNRLKDIINSFEEPTKFKKFYLISILLTSAILFGRIFLFFIDFIPYSPDESKMGEFTLATRHFVQSSPVIYEITMYLLGFCIGIFPALWFLSKFVSLWPSIEIQIGPEHRLEPKNKRKKLKNFFTFILLPLIIAMLYDILKYLF